MIYCRGSRAEWRPIWARRGMTRGSSPGGGSGPQPRGRAEHRNAGRRDRLHRGPVRGRPVGSARPSRSWSETSPSARKVDFFHSARRFIDDQGRPMSGVPARRARRSPRDLSRSGVDQAPLCWRRELARDRRDRRVTRSRRARRLRLPLVDGRGRRAVRGDFECLYVFATTARLRLTTHLPLRPTYARSPDVAKARRAQAEIRRRVAKAREGYLRQCLYSSPLDAWSNARFGHDPASGWRDSY